MNSVRKRLLDPVQGTSDGVIGTVLAFACFSVCSTCLTQVEAIRIFLEPRAPILGTKRTADFVAHGFVKDCAVTFPGDSIVEKEQNPSGK